LKTPLISVVVAAYNVEKYIEECLNSILNQTFQDWECIIVDDASTDNTLSIIKTYADKDQRFRYDSLPVNSGSCKEPRDKALTYAQGEWILKVDADDFIDDNVMERLYARAMHTGADIVLLRLKMFDGDTLQHKMFCPEMDFDMQRTLTGGECVMFTLFPEWVVPGNGLHRKKLWDKRSTFNAGINHINVDEYDSREMFIHANFIVLEDVIYHYRLHASSESRKICLKWFEQTITEKMVENLVHNHFGKDSRQALIVSQWRIYQLIFSFKYNVIYRSKLSYQERKESKKLLKEHFKTIDKRFIPYKGIKRKIFNSFTLFDWYIFYCSSDKMSFFRKLMKILKKVYSYIKQILKKIYIKFTNPVCGEILMLHSVVEKRSQIIENRNLEVTPSFLEQTILKYKSLGYRFVSLDEIQHQMVTRKRHSRKFVCFTIDDGFADNYELAYPVFKKHNCPFIIYVTTDYVDKKAQFWWCQLEVLVMKNEKLMINGIEYDCSDLEKKNRVFSEIAGRVYSSYAGTILSLKQLYNENDYNTNVRALSWEQIVDLAADPLCTIGAHTVSHPSLPMLSDEKIRKELSDGKKIIEEKINKPVKHFSYPYGDCDSRVAKLAMEQFSTAVLATEDYVRKKDNVYLLNRSQLIE